MRSRTAMVLSVLVIMVCSLAASEGAEERRCPLVFGMSVTCQARGDTMEVVALAVADNHSDQKMDICGSFVFTAAYEPDSVALVKGRGWPTFFAFDSGGSGSTLECDQVVLGPYDRISDSFTFRYFPRYFVGFPGKITIRAIFVYGSPGLSWDAAHKCDARELRASIGVPRLRP